MIKWFASLLLSAVLLAPPVSASASNGGNVFTETRMKEIVSDYIRTKTANLGFDIRIKRVECGKDVTLSPGAVSWEVVSPAQWEGWGNGSLALILRVDDRVEKNIPVRVEVEALAEMVVAARALDYGEIIGPRDVAIQKRDLATVNGRVCRRLEDVVGKKVRMGLRANAPIGPNQLEKVPLVKSGDVVTIVAESNSIRITATGRARSSGAAGDQVMVQNQASQKIVTGTVIDASTVQVQF